MLNELFEPRPIDLLTENALDFGWEAVDESGVCGSDFRGSSPCHSKKDFGSVDLSSVFRGIADCGI